MARKTTALSDTEIKRAKPTSKEYSLGDGNGLLLRIKPNGSKLWIFNYIHPHNRKRANIGLGSYPILSLAKAREIRQQYRSLLIEQIDPGQHRAEQTQQSKDAHELTLERIADKWFDVKKGSVSKDYAEDVYRSLRLHIFPRLGSKPLHLLKATQAIEVLKPIAAKGSMETVKRLCQRLNEVMVFALNSGLIESNPISGIGKAFIPPAKKLMPSIAPDKLPELMNKVANASIRRATRCLIEWQLHTMTRPSEAAGARWSEIDYEKLLWIIPAERMKKKLEHSIPLAPQALALLEIMRPISGNREYIFPSDKNPRKHTNSQTANMALKRMGYGGTLVAHGMRSLASTTLNEEGFDSDLIESALAHVGTNEVRAAYNRAKYIERRRPMMKWWSDHIEKASQGSYSLAVNVLLVKDAQREYVAESSNRFAHSTE